MLQPPQLSKTQRAFGKLGQVASSQAVAALIHSTMGTPGGQGPVGGTGGKGGGGGAGDVVSPKENIQTLQKLCTALPHLLVTSLFPTKNLASQPPQLSKIHVAEGKLGQVASAQAVGALMHPTIGTPGGHVAEGGLSPTNNKKYLNSMAKST